MDLLDEPETKEIYDKCKFTVKVWEHKFIRKHNRMPSKLDIREAPSKVKSAYRKYFQLKNSALEQSFRDVEGFENFSQNEDDELAELQILKEYAENEQNILCHNIENRVSPNSVENEENTAKCDTIWNVHLNKNIDSDMHQVTRNDKGTSNPVNSITKKLFCGSKFNKRNPRKSLSFTQKKNSDVSFDCSQFLSQPETSFTKFESEEALNVFHSDDKIFYSQERFKSSELKRITSSVPISIVDSVLENRQTSLKKIDTGWLNRVTENIGNSLSLSTDSEKHIYSNNIQNDVMKTKVDYDSDDVIEKSDDEQNVSIFHVAKKSKVSYECNIHTDKNESVPVLNVRNNITIDVPASHKFSLQSVEDKNNEKPNALEKITNDTKNVVDNLIYDNQFSQSSNIKMEDKQLKNESNIKNKIVDNNIVSNTNKSKNENISLRRSSRKNIAKSSFEELSSSEKDPFDSDDSEKDPDFSVQSETKLPNNQHFDFGDSTESNSNINELDKNTKKEPSNKHKKRSTKKTVRKSAKNELSENHSENDCSSKYELEFSIKRRIVKPRYNAIKNIFKENIAMDNKEHSTVCNENQTDTTIVKDKKQQAKEKLEQKVSSGMLNDNFVTLNLRKKVFVRGKKGKNFSKMKKAMWKSKKKALYGPDMDMGGCDGGKLMCFNCGQEGHFARACKAGKGDGLLPILNEEEEECPFPTLEEASKMASESALSIRKPKIAAAAENSGNLDELTNPADYTNVDDQEEDQLFEDVDSEVLLAEMLKLEEYVRKIDVQSYMDNIKTVAPYYNLDELGALKGTPQEMYEALTKFGHSTFRGGQEKAIMRILSGQSTLVTLSTGSGKSLCYQLPAYLYSQREPCISLVISPLVSLMEDQVTGIPSFLKAACLHTNQTKTQREKIMDALSKGNINVLLISPEAVVAGEKQTGFGSLLRKLPPIAFACIDEAHCVSQWSHNFRPSYLMISRVLKESLGVKTILGLTATATKATCQSIIDSLAIPDGLNGVISDIPIPDNLHLTASRDPNRDRALVNLLLSQKFKYCKSIIVYCTRRDECERIASFLRTSLKNETVVESSNKKRKRLNLQAEPYHAGLSASRRRTVQNAFMSGDLRIVVATVAFGMGINKSDIRAVIHFNMPNSFESYVQEVGRAGRDGLPSYCHVFLDSQGRDENELCRHIYGNSIDRHVIRKLLKKIFVPCACKDVCPKHEVGFSIDETVKALDIPEENISTLLCYLELHEHKYIELLNPAYTICKVISYGGVLQIRKAAKDCPPLAMALALYKSKPGEENILEFPIIEVASAMGWESGICKHKLKNLEWITVNNQQKRSALSVQFSNLGFRLLAPGNLSDERLDEGLDSLHKQVVDQETKALKQLHAVHKTLLEVAEKSYNSCVNTEEGYEKSTDVLKQKIREYFNSSDPLASIEKLPSKKMNEDQLVSDIRAMICMYRDNQFTGRSLARIFQGIQSPNYPAVIWGRCKFWRSHLHEDFNEICRIATREIIRLK
ncbi:ATP-dependent DNA helicase Q4 isoform X1 [Sitophilus oryzae]|uniref:DNA 3'-5' helicase n=1 Tax=Sitophilus oryzae TaxID=7048 RepID=A0A6J2XST3_SITOR|nr:ATP-dependent DNA helicase Q4 isoform X1 [Sitophilus oryzae]